INSKKIDIKQLKKGIYFIQVIYPDKMYATYKLIKK
ncbi:MAG: T9SS type A sorting domain-containing protein, partial [Bacteroidetes bacterium]|nr:T9SS type A sorting domain-containing protein [Bacteroidota bacterium]